MGVVHKRFAGVNEMGRQIRYVLHPACRVRKEKFGLLFYDLRGPKLLFANTGDLLEPEFFEGRAGVEAPQRVRSFLASLVEKGFLREQPIR